MNVGNLQDLSAAIGSVIAADKRAPFVHPGRNVQPPRQVYRPREQHEPPPPPNNARKIVTFVGASRKMQAAYKVIGGDGREYHRIYDFDVSHERLGVDFLPFNGLFLALQHAERRFVAAHLLIHSRDVLAAVVQSDAPRIVQHGGRYYVHLQFAEPSGYPGLPLLACRNTTFTVRVIVNEKTGTNFFLLAEGLCYDPMYEGETRAAVTRVPMHVPVVWAKCVHPEMLRCEHGWCTLQNPHRPWEPQECGPATRQPSPPVEMYDPEIVGVGSPV